MKSASVARLRVVGEAGEGTPAPAPDAPEKRRGGRPKGSKNKVSRDAKELLAEHGIAGIKMLCAIAQGRSIRRPMKGGKAHEVLTPDLDQMLAAQKIIIGRLVPELKAQELSGKDGAPLMPAPAIGSDFTTMALCMGATDAAQATARAILKDVNGNPTGDPDRLAAAILKARTPAQEADDAARQETVSEQLVPKESSHDADADAEIVNDQGEMRAIVRREGNGWTIRRSDDKRHFGDFTNKADAIARARQLVDKGYI